MRRWLVAAIALGLVASAPVVAPVAGSAACVETPRPDPSLPVFEAQRAVAGFHSEELVLCSPGKDEPTHLAARLWVPATCPGTGGCAGVVVVHGFGATKELTFADMRDLALRGMYVLSYDVRGQGASGGQAGLMGPEEIADEAHVLRWFHRQVRPSKVGVFGISQGGAHALMAAVYNCGAERAATLDLSVPCDAGGRWVDAIVPVQAPSDMGSDGTCLMFMVSAIPYSRGHPGVASSFADCALDGGPLEEAGDAATPPVPPVDPSTFEYRSRAGAIDVPVYLATSFYDRLVVPQQVADMYAALKPRVETRLIVSNDAHGDIGANFAVLGDLFTWLERTLEGDPVPIRDAPVAVAQEWDGDAFRLESDWPVPGTAVAELRLADGRLENRPVVASPPGTPVVGGALPPARTVGLLPGDHLSYDTDVTELVEVTDLPAVRLWLSSSGRAAQLNVSLSEVLPTGEEVEFARGRRGIRDLSTAPQEVLVPLSLSTHRVDPGSRLRLTITLSDVNQALPYLDPAGVTVHGDADHPSALLLPTVDPHRDTVPGPVPTGTSFADDPAGTICQAVGC